MVGGRVGGWVVGGLVGGWVGVGEWVDGRWVGGWVGWLVGLGDGVDPRTLARSRSLTRAIALARSCPAYLNSLCMFACNGAVVVS